MRGNCTTLLCSSLLAIAASSVAAQEVPPSGESKTATLVLHWRVPVPNDPTDEELVDDLSQQFAKDKVPAILQFGNQVAGRYVLMRTPNCAMGVDFQAGKRVWEYPWFRASFESPATVTRRSRVPELNFLGQRLWHDATFASLTVSGDRLFMLDKLEPVSTELRSDRRTLVLPGGARGEPFLTTSNELVALRISRQGTLQWIVGGDTGGDESQLAGYFFLSSGTAHDDRLYVVGQKENKLQLLALESETGKLEWSVVLLEFEAGDSALVNPLRRLSGVAPVIVGKRLLCPTAHGKIVAVDVEERKVAWTAAYEATKQPPARFRLPGAGLGAGELALQQGAQWLDNAVHAAGDLAIVTPIDSPQMYCLDTATGEGKWQRERDDRLFVAVRDNVCLLFGPDNVAACNVRDGTPLWDDRRIAYSESGTMISGRGVFDGDRYLLPVGKELIALDWRKGTVAVIAKSESPLGNLSLHEGAILSQGVDWLQKLWLKY